MRHSRLIHFQLDHKSCRREPRKRQERKGGGSCLAAGRVAEENNDLYEIALDTI